MTSQIIMKQIDEIIDLIELTGEKCIILHPEKGAYAVLPMDEYKKLIENKKKEEEIAKISKPDTDVRLYEIPRAEDVEDKYYPEPL